MTPEEILRAVETVLVIDWPSKDVPEALARAGFQVVVKGGPGAEDYSAYELKENDVVTRRIGRSPADVDLIYSYRPLSELRETIAMAKGLHAKTIWWQSGVSAAGVNDPKGCWASEEELQSVRQLVESAGLDFITQPYIGDVARNRKAS